MTPEKRLSEIERLVSKEPPGPHGTAVWTISQHVFALRGDVKGNYANEKLAGIEEWAKIYFSQRRYEKYAGGAEQVAAWILADCKAVKDSL